jgi:pyruvate-ferredoxin/flavodoxin oxidoreductase
VHGLEQQKKAVHAGAWLLFRYDPRLREAGKNPLQLDAKAPSIPLEDFAYNETRYTMLVHSDPEGASRALRLAEEEARRRWRLYEQLASVAG